MTDESVAEYQLTRIAETLDLILAVLERAYPAQAATPAQPAQGAPQPLPAQRIDKKSNGRAAFCDCPCDCWQSYDGRTSLTCCECQSSKYPNQPCSCRGREGERLEKRGRYYRWVPGTASAPLAPVEQIDPDDLPF